MADPGLRLSLIRPPCSLYLGVTCNNLFNPHENPLKYVLLNPHFIGRELNQGAVSSTAFHARPAWLG